MKHFLFIILSIFFLTSCMDYQTDVYINNDGSGKIKTKVDMSGMMEMIEMMSAMEKPDSLQQEDTDESPEDFLKGAFSDTENERIDTSFSMGAVIPDSIEISPEDRSLMDKMRMGFILDKAERSFMFNIDIDFDKEEDIQAIMETFAKTAQQDDRSRTMNSEELSKAFNQWSGEFTYGHIAVPETDYSEDLGDEEINLDSLSNDELEMMKMMVGGSVVTTYHLPGKVKKVSGGDFIKKIDKNTVQVTNDVMDIIERKKTPAYTIEYKTKNKRK